MMDRILEKELMDDQENARAYAEADFAEPHDRFVDIFRNRFPQWPGQGFVLDLGCGPADVTIRFSLAFPSCHIHGVDGAEAMVTIGQNNVFKRNLSTRIKLFQGYVPDLVLPRSTYDVIISNSLLHHLPDPAVLWDCVKSYASAGTKIYIMDLYRPQNTATAKDLVWQYAKDESPVLQDDFFNSLCASFRPEEIDMQLKTAGMGHLSIETVSDRHLVVHGRI